MVQGARRWRAKQHFPRSKFGKQSEVCAPAAPAPRPLAPRPALPWLAETHLPRCAPQPRLPAAPTFTAAPRGHLLGPGHTRSAASTTHPAQPREPRVSVSAKLCRRPHKLSNFPAAQEQPLPASARKPEGSLAAILRRLYGPALTGGGPQGRCQSRWRAQGADEKYRTGSLGLKWPCGGPLGLITDSSSFSRLRLNCDSVSSPPSADGCACPGALHGRHSRAWRRGTPSKSI